MEPRRPARPPRPGLARPSVARDRLLLLLGALVLLAATTAVALGSEIPGVEGDAVRGIAGWPSWLEPPLVAVMQLGTLTLLPAVAIGLWFVTRRAAAVLASLVAAPVADVLAGRVKEAVERGRPDVLDGFEPRATAGGHGFVSGHTAVAFALAAVVAGMLPGRWRWAPWVAASLVGLARVYEGVHFPLDVLGGAALGTLVGSVVLWIVTARSLAAGAGGEDQGRGPSATSRSTTL